MNGWNEQPRVLTRSVQLCRARRMRRASQRFALGVVVSSSGVFQGLKHPVAADDLLSWTISSAHSNSRRDRLQGLWHPVVQIGKHATLKSLEQ